MSTNVNPTGGTLSGQTGTGQFVGSTSPTLVAPILGTPVSGVLTNCTNAPTYLLAQRTTSQSFSSATFTKVQLATKITDAGGYFDNTTNYRYTPLVAGKFLFIGSVGLGSSAVSGNQLYVAIYKNGAAASTSISFVSTSSTFYVQVTGLLDMNGSTDYAELFVYTDATSPALAADGAKNYLVAYRLL